MFGAVRTNTVWARLLPALQAINSHWLLRGCWQAWSVVRPHSWACMGPSWHGLWWGFAPWLASCLFFAISSPGHFSGPSHGERGRSASLLFCVRTWLLLDLGISLLIFFTPLIRCLWKTCLQIQLLWRFPLLHRDWWRLEYRLWCCLSRSIYIFTEWVCGPWGHVPIYGGLPWLSAKTMSVFSC